MELDKQEICGICNDKFSSFKRTMVTEIKDLLNFISVKINSEVQDSLICQTCLWKVEAAHKFKTSYSQISQMTSSLVKEEPCSENQIECKICKNIIGLNDCVPLFNSMSETGLSLIKYFSPLLESETYSNSYTCELCHKSLINFYHITNLLSTFGQNHINHVNESDNVNVKKELQEAKDYGISVDETFRIDSEEKMCILENTKEEIGIDEFRLKSEVIYFKIDEDNFEVDGTEHQSERADDIKMFEYSICGNKTENQYIFEQHMLQHMNSNKLAMFKCQICEYETKYIRYLQRHMSKHKKFEMFKCKICEFETKRKYYLKKHMFTHNKSDEVEMFKCNTCEYKTIHKGCLKAHIPIHKNPDEVEVYKCQICEFKTRHKYYLKKHVLKHTKSEEIGRFKCHLCDYVTTSKYILKKHVLNHKNFLKDDMYKCQICEYETKYNKYFMKHLLTHGIDPMSKKKT